MTSTSSVPVAGLSGSPEERPAHAVLRAVSADAGDQRRWRVEEVDFSRIDRDRIAQNEALFYLLVSASFIESGSDLYTSNLTEHYAAYPEVQAWLRRQWEREELQHGRTFELYVKAAWPEFPWQLAFEGFLAEYGRLCTVEELEPDRALEMAARCVVEMGTTTYYQTLRGLSDEPLLTELLGHVRTDEVNHYKHFLAYFKQLSAAQPVSRLRVARVLYARLVELRDSDSDVALRHVWAHKGALFPQGAQRFEDIRDRVFALVSTQLPADQAVRMLLKPLQLPHRVEKWIEPPLAALARRVIAA